jgi:microcystin-dependent protein
MEPIANGPILFPLCKKIISLFFITTKDGPTQRVQSNYQVKPLQKQVIYPVTGKPLEVGCKIALLRKTPLTQELDLVNNGGFFPENIEQTFDRSVLVEQELLEQLERAVKMPETSNDNRDFAYEIIESRNRAELAAQKSETAQQGSEEHSTKAEQQGIRAKQEADRARQAADEAVTGGIRSVNRKQGNDIVLTPEDIQASPEGHSHDLLDQIPKIETENAGKSLLINSDGTKAEWQMLSGVPVGTIIAWGGLTPPAGYLECAGQSLSRTIYKGLFLAIGTAWGSDSAETFRLPDFKSAARFLRSRGDGLEVGELQGDAIRNIKGTFVSHFMHDQNGHITDFSTGAIQMQSMQYLNNVPIAAGHGNSKMKMILDISKAPDVKVDNENRPKSAVVMYCIKAVDEYINPEQVNMADVVREIEERVRREEVQKLAGTRLWVSEEYQPVLNTPTIVEHGLDIDPLKCKWEALLVCKDSEHGYNEEEYAIGVTSLTLDSGIYVSCSLVPSLQKQTIQINAGNHNPSFYAHHKNHGGRVGLTSSNWRLIFRIWY